MYLYTRRNNSPVRLCRVSRFHAELRTSNLVKSGLYSTLPGTIHPVEGRTLVRVYMHIPIYVKQNYGNIVTPTANGRNRVAPSTSRFDGISSCMHTLDSSTVQLYWSITYLNNYTVVESAGEVSQLSFTVLQSSVRYRYWSTILANRSPGRMSLSTYSTVPRAQLYVQSWYVHMYENDECIRTKGMSRITKEPFFHFEISLDERMAKNTTARWEFQNHCTPIVYCRIARPPPHLIHNI
jgi:hypothetical protein